MFKRKEKTTNPGEQVQAKAPEPTRTVAEVEAEKAIARGRRIKQLSDEAVMWRNFAVDCKAGREIYEYPGRHLWDGEFTVARLSVLMDEDTAPLWVAFANQMAVERERRLKDLLGV